MFCFSFSCPVFSGHPEAVLEKRSGRKRKPELAWIRRNEEWQKAKQIPPPRSFCPEDRTNWRRRDEPTVERGQSRPQEGNPRTESGLSVRSCLVHQNTRMRAGKKRSGVVVQNGTRHA